MPSLKGMRTSFRASWIERARSHLPDIPKKNAARQFGRAATSDMEP